MPGIENPFTRLKEKYGLASRGVTPGFNPDAPHPVSEIQPKLTVRGVLQALDKEGQKKISEIAKANEAIRQGQDDILRRINSTTEADGILKDNPELKKMAETLVNEYTRLARATGRDPEEIAREQLESKSFSRILLRNMIMSFSGQPYKRYYTELLEQAQQSQAANIQRMGIIADSIESFARSDASRLASRVNERGQTVRGAETVLQSQQKTAQGDRNILEKIRQGQIGLARDSTLEDQRQAGRLELERERQAGREKISRSEKDPVDVSLDKGGDALTGSYVDASRPRTVIFNKSTRKLEYSANENVPYDYKPKMGSAELAAMSDGVQSIRRATNAMRSVLERGEDINLVRLKESISGFVAPLISIFSDDQEDKRYWEGVFNDAVLSRDEAELSKQLRDFTLLKIVSRSGKQVTDSERAYVEGTLARLVEPDHVFAVGIELTRILAELSQARATDVTPINDRGDTKTAYVEGRRLVTRRHDDTLQKITERAEALIESKGLGAAVDFLEKIDGGNLESTANTALGNKTGPGTNLMDVSEEDPTVIQQLEDFVLSP